MRERLKSLALALLLLLAIGLSYVSLTLGVQSDALPGSWLSRLTGMGGASAPTAAGSFSASTAAWPEKLSVLMTTGLYDAPYGDAYEGLWALVQPFYAEALGSGGAPRQLGQSAFAEALRAPAILLRYGTALPFSLLRAWSEAPAGDTELTVRSVVLCASETGVRLLFRDGSGACWEMDTAASQQNLLEICTGEYAVNAVLAGSDRACAALLPEEPVYTGTAVVYPFCRLEPTAAAAAGELPRAVLSAFALNPYLAKVYQDSTGGTVYVESRSTLQVTEEGDLIYTAADTGIPIELPAGEGRAARDARVCDAAFRLVSGVWQELSAGGQLSLDSMSFRAEQEEYVLRFELALGGMFLDLGDRCWAQVVVRNGAITDVLLCPRRVSEEGGTALLPLRQAAAALEESAAWRLSVRWLAQGEALLRPAVCKVK